MNETMERSKRMEDFIVCYSLERCIKGEIKRHYLFQPTKTFKYLLKNAPREKIRRKRSRSSEIPNILAHSLGSGITFHSDCHDREGI